MKCFESRKTSLSKKVGPSQKFEGKEKEKITSSANKNGPADSS